MRRWPTSTLRGLYLWAWERSTLVATVLVLLIFGRGAWRSDVNVRDDLRYALLDAYADVGHLILNYQAAKSFSSRQILELCTEELQDAQSSWGPVSSKLLLQAINVKDRIIYDSRSRKIETKLTLLPPASCIEKTARRPWEAVDTGSFGHRTQLAGSHLR